MDQKKKEIRAIRKKIEKSATKNQMQQAPNKMMRNWRGKEMSDWYLRRIQTVALEIMNGKSPGQIHETYGAEWQVKYDTIRTVYMVDARQFIASQILTDDADIRIDLLAKYNHLYQLNMIKGDHKEARMVLDSVAKVTQLISPQMTIFANIDTIKLVEIQRAEDNLNEFEKLDLPNE